MSDTTTPPASRKTVFIETLGCQMNKNDSEFMMGLLEKEGFEAVSQPEGADLAIINTCQIRGQAEDKAYSYLGHWGRLKKRHPQMKIAMAGCVAQQTKDGVFKRAPYVDLVFGTQNIQDLPQLIRRVFAQQEDQVLLCDRQKNISTYDFYTDVTPRRESTISAWVTIIEGCDYFCTYCVVPYTRGRQISRPPESIIAEVEQLAQGGFKEITLLGQTVDSYGKDFKDRSYTMAQLLYALNDIDGIERIRFMTSHPLDLDDALIDAVAALPKVMEYIHIPMQAGDSGVLARMRRGYTDEQYYTLVDKLHERIPGVAISGDYIVGFPGESDEAFQRTVESVARSRVDNANVAIYSPRHQTPAGIWETRGEEVPHEVKEERFKILTDVIREQARTINATYLNTTVEVLVEGPSKRNPERLTGRTRTNKVVNFDTCQPAEALVGKMVDVEIIETLPFSLRGVHTATRSSAEDVMAPQVQTASAPVAIGV